MYLFGRVLRERLVPALCPSVFRHFYPGCGFRISTSHVSPNRGAPITPIANTACRARSGADGGDSRSRSRCRLVDMSAVVARWISSSVKSTDNPERIAYETICAIYFDNYDEGRQAALARNHERGSSRLALLIGRATKA